MATSIPGLPLRKVPPRYTRARDAILGMIEKGIYPPGSQLPPETELSSMLGVSRVIIREALRVLEEDLLIIRRHGMPTCVAYPYPVLQSDLNKNYSFSEVIQINGLAPGVSYLKIFTRAADTILAEKLGIKPGKPVVVIQRVRTANERPVAYTLDIFPQGAFKYSSDDFASGASIYASLEMKGTPVHHGLARILPVKAGVEVAEKLGINPETVILVIEQVDYTEGNQPLLYTEEYHLRQAFQFTVYRVRETDALTSGKPTSKRSTQ